MQQSQLALLFLAGQQKQLIRPDKTLGYLSWIIALPEIQAAHMVVTLVSAWSETKESFRQTLLPSSLVFSPAKGHINMHFSVRPALLRLVSSTAECFRSI